MQHQNCLAVEALYGKNRMAIPEMARMPLQVLARQWERQNADICKLEGQIVRAAKTDEVARRLIAIPGLAQLAQNRHPITVKSIG
jgi:transposase